MSEQNKENLVTYLLVNGKDSSWENLAKTFKIKDGETARKIWLRYRTKNNLKETGITISEDIRSTEEGEFNFTKVVELKEDLKTGMGEVTIQSDQEIKSLDDLKKLIDMEKWDISKYIQNFWNNKYQVKAWLEPKKTSNEDVIGNLLKNYKSTWRPLEAKHIKINTNWQSDSLLVINLNDLHFDKLDLSNNTIDQRIADYHKCLETLVMKAYHSSKIEEVVFVVGNDLFNTDNIHNTTTNGTPQNVNATWDLAYEKVFEAMVVSIAKLKSFCKKVNVLLVQGNHDRTKSYYLAHALETHFKGDKAITFDRTSNLKKIFVYGNTFLGFNHGNNVNDKLPLSFATEFYAEWGQCKFHDILISDKHHNNEKVFKSNQTQNEFQGVKLRILPSLSGTDKWHNDNLYHSRQSGIALVYDKTAGKCAEFEYQL